MIYSRYRNSKSMSDNAKAWLAVIALFCAYALVGTMDYEDQVMGSDERVECRKED